MLVWSLSNSVQPGWQLGRAPLYNVTTGFYQVVLEGVLGVNQLDVLSRCLRPSLFFQEFSFNIPRTTTIFWNSLANIKQTCFQNSICCRGGWHHDVLWPMRYLAKESDTGSRNHDHNDLPPTHFHYDSGSVVNISPEKQKSWRGFQMHFDAIFIFAKISLKRFYWWIS